MSSGTLLVAGLLVLTTLGSMARAAELRRSIASRPCRSAPTIDGAIGPDEWRDAAVLQFDMRMVSVAPPATETRSSELRVMNSANALYIALRVPDKTINNRLTPLDLDMATLAFCRNDEVKPGDDRKMIAEGVYVDKHIAAGGKDDDDSQQDGRGRVGRADGAYVFEWAVPLQPADSNDLSARPGDSVRFNVTFIDAFHPDLRDTRLGGTFGHELKTAKDWGVIRLAADVVDDGGSAFRGPAWLEQRLRVLRNGLAARLRLVGSEATPVNGKPGAKSLFTFNYRDPYGQTKEAKGKLFLPPEVHSDANARVPLYFVAGYELDDQSAMNFVKRGWAVVSPRALETNPLIRTFNPDVALLHIARAFPFVDDTRVMIGGGSAGGYVTLMLAAETFPLAGAAPDVPPMNWGYNGAYFFRQVDSVAAPKDGEKTSKVPAMFMVATLLKPCKTVYGEDYGDKLWFAHSPIAHLSTISCPVSVYWSTADMLVPIDQIGKRWVQPFATGDFPAGFTMDPEKLTSTPEGRTRLFDVLPKDAYEIFRVAVPEGTVRHAPPSSLGKAKFLEIPVSPQKLWSITIVDEGPPTPLIDHRKFTLLFNRDAFFKQINTGKVAPQQLTAAKLERLMDRYAGKEWLPTRLKHLDQPESERSDVLRGLRTYVKGSSENAKRFAELYRGLAVDKQMLSADAVRELTGSTAE